MTRSGAATALIFVAAAIGSLPRLLPHGFRALGALASLALVVAASLPTLSTPPVYRQEDMRPVLAFVKDHWQMGDLAYVYYGAVPAVTYYAERYGLTPEDYLLGGCHRGDSRLYLVELDRLRSRRRVWVLLTHALPLFREREDIVGYLDAIGSRRETFAAASRAVGALPSNAEALLYDLSDPGRLARASAGTFELESVGVRDRRLACGEGPLAVLSPDAARLPGRP